MHGEVLYHDSTVGYSIQETVKLLVTFRRHGNRWAILKAEMTVLEKQGWMQRYMSHATNTTIWASQRAATDPGRSLHLTDRLSLWTAHGGHHITLKPHLIPARGLDELIFVLDV